MPHIPMPSDFDREITDDSLGEEIKVSVPADLVKALKSLAIACGTTLFVTVLSAWKVCALDCHLCRYRDISCQRLILNMSGAWNVCIKLCNQQSPRFAVLQQ